MTSRPLQCLLAHSIDRTPFQQESNLHAFQQAIDDTIRVLSTGIWQTREGVEIHRFPSLHHIRDAGIGSALELTVRELDQLRRRFKVLLSSGEIRPCGCGNPSCPTFMLTDTAAREMDRARDRVLAAFRRPYPSFNVVLE